MEAYNAAQTAMDHREAKVQKAVNLLEQDLDFLGVSGVEDKLQLNVQTTIDALKGAGLQVWMLTGDRVETGTSIAISAGFKSRTNELFFITEYSN